MHASRGDLSPDEGGWTKVKYIVVLDIEAKEDDSGVFPDPHDMRAWLRDRLIDITKHDETIGWRVSNVDGLRQTVLKEVIL